MQGDNAYSLQAVRGRLTVPVQPIVVGSGSGVGEIGVGGDAQGQLVGTVYHRHIDLIGIHIGEARPRIVGAHAPVVERLALRGKDVAVHADETPFRLRSPNLTVDEADDVAPRRLRVDRAARPVGRVDGRIGFVNLHDVTITVDANLGPFPHVSSH